MTDPSTLRTIAESIRRDLVIELVLANTAEEMQSSFTQADSNFERENIPMERRTAMLQEIRRNLSYIMDRQDKAHCQKLVAEGEEIIDRMLQVA